MTERAMVVIKEPGKPASPYVGEPAMDRLAELVGGSLRTTTIATCRKNGFELRMFVHHDFATDDTLPENFPFNGDRGYFIRGVATFTIISPDNAQYRAFDDVAFEAVYAYVCGLPTVCREIFRSA